MFEQSKPQGTPTMFVKLHILKCEFQSLRESFGELYISSSRIDFWDGAIRKIPWGVQ